MTTVFTSSPSADFEEGFEEGFGVGVEVGFGASVIKLDLLEVGLGDSFGKSVGLGLLLTAV
jgi:hypothetical protein